MSVDQSLIGEACGRFGGTVIGGLKDGGQKVVKVVHVRGETLVLKLVEIGDSKPDALARAHREVHLLKSINSPHVVQVRSDLLELGDPPRGAAWLEEYLDGNDLSFFLHDPWPWSEIRRLAYEVASGLQCLHQEQVVHRDLSANNIRRTSSGTYKVLDPGFARHTLLSGLTVGGQPGTPGFMSPEHLNVYSGAPTASSDIFALGILLFAAATGSLPIPYRGNDDDYISRLREARIPDLSKIRPDLPIQGVDLIYRCLHKQPARRFRNGGDLATRLETLQ